jgi:hypothetical protein
VGNTDAVLYAVGTGTGTPTTTSGKINAYSASLGDVIIDGPMVDPSAGTVYVFVTTNTDTSSPSNAVFQFSTSFSGSGTSYGNGSGDYGTEIGTGGTGFYLYAGAFDNAYLVSTPSSPSGNLWVAGNTGTAGGATLYQVPIVSNAMQSPVTAVTGLSTTDYAYPTPLTEFCNNGTTGCSVAGGTDYLFFSVYGSTLSANSTNCGASGLLGCVLGYNITTTTPSLAGVLPIKAVPTSLGTGCWATGGIVIDNAYSAAEYGSSQVYFIDLGGNEAGGPTSGTYTSSKCATGSGNTIYAAQASQSKLQ